MRCPSTFFGHIAKICAHMCVHNINAIHDDWWWGSMSTRMCRSHPERERDWMEWKWHSRRHSHRCGANYCEENVSSWRKRWFAFIAKLNRVRPAIFPTFAVSNEQITIPGASDTHSLSLNFYDWWWRTSQHAPILSSFLSAFSLPFSCSLRRALASMLTFCRSLQGIGADFWRLCAQRIIFLRRFRLVLFVLRLELHTNSIWSGKSIRSNGGSRLRWRRGNRLTCRGVRKFANVFGNFVRSPFLSTRPVAALHVFHE